MSSKREMCTGDPRENIRNEAIQIAGTRSESEPVMSGGNELG